MSRSGAVIVGKPPKKRKSPRQKRHAEASADVLRELSLLRETLRRRDGEAAAYKAQVDELRWENKRLSALISEGNEQENLLESHLHQQLRLANNNVEKLQEALRANKDAFGREVEALALQYEDRLRSLEILLDKNEEEHKAALSELSALRSYKTMTEHLGTELGSLITRTQETKAEHVRATAENEVRVQEQLQALATAYQKRADETESHARKVALEHMDAETRWIVRENSRMAKELQTHYRENTALLRQMETMRKRMEEMETELGRLRRRERVQGALYARPSDIVADIKEDLTPRRRKRDERVVTPEEARRARSNALAAVQCASKTAEAIAGASLPEYLMRPRGGIAVSQRRLHDGPKPPIQPRNIDRMNSHHRSSSQRHGQPPMLMQAPPSPVLLGRRGNSA